MYFLIQLKIQFLSFCFHSFNPSEAAVSSTPVEQELAADAVGFGQDFDNMSSSELLEELKKRLDSLKAAESIVGPEAQVLINFCTKVKEGKVAGLGPEDDDFVRLSAMACKKVEKYQNLAGEAAQIDDAIAAELHKITVGVNKEIADPEGNAVTVETDEKFENNSRELRSLYDAHIMSLNERLQNLPHGFKLSNEIQAMIDEVEGLGIEKGLTPEEQIVALTERNAITVESINAIDTKIEEKQLLDVQLLIDSRILSFNERLQSLPKGLERTDNIKELITNFQELEKTENTGILGAQIIAANEKNNKMSEVIVAIDSAIQIEQNALNYNNQLPVYTVEDLPKLIETMDGEKAKFRKVFFEDILGEEDTGKPLSEYKEHEKVKAFENKTPEGHQFGYSLVVIIDAFEAIKVEQSSIPQEHGEALHGAGEGYKRFNRNLGIVARDATVLEGGETLGETRLELTHQGYKNLTLNEDGTLTEAGKAIATGNESVEPASSRLPNFEDLRMDQIKMLRDSGANMKKLFLVHPSGENFDSGLLEEGKSYIVNFSANTELANKMDFSFIDSSAGQIEIDGVPVTFNKTGKRGAGYYDENNQQVLIKDGSVIKVVANRTETNPDIGEAIDAAVKERLDSFAQTSAQERAVVQAIMSGNPGGNFDTSKLPGGLAGAFVAMILNMFDGRNFKYNPETKIWEEKPEGSQGPGNVLTNRDIIGAYRGSMELGSLSARFESSSQGSRAYNPNDNGHGPSYGTYQMNSEVGVHRSFIQKHGIADGKAGWMEAIHKYGAEEFSKMEHEHIKQNNYDPMIRRITVKNKENFSIAMQNVIWSIGVQHGPGHSGLNAIINNSGVTPGDKKSEAALINALYDKRERIWPAGVASRYRPERADALAMLNTMASSEIPNIYEQGLQNVPAGTRSVGTPSGYTTPQCSMVARQNLEKFGLTSIKQGASAKASFEMYPSERITAFPPAAGSDAKIADFYLDASSKNAQYGHRVAAYESAGQWYVLDPYYNTPGYSDTRAPIKAEDYIAMMEKKDPPRKFWGAAYFK